jgi:hypothetical protein
MLTKLAGRYYSEVCVQDWSYSYSLSLSAAKSLAGDSKRNIRITTFLSIKGNSADAKAIYVL